MSRVAKVHFSSPLFISTAVILIFTDAFPIGTILFGWLGGVQLLNFLASRTPFSRLIHWAYAMTFEGLAIIGVLFFRFLPKNETVSGRGKPLLLVHGYINHSSVWRLQKARLEALGLGPIYTIDLGHPFRSIETYAETLKEKVQMIAQETGRTDLILIGHSMGGLVSCWYATQMASPGTITDVITIGSPFLGTRIARIGLGPNAREMEPESPLLKELNEALVQDTQTRFYHIASKTDQVVIPGGSAIVPHHQHYIYYDIGHASLLYSRRVTEKIGEWVSQAGSN